jgi:hypothetical protein
MATPHSHPCDWQLVSTTPQASSSSHSRCAAAISMRSFGGSGSLQPGVAKIVITNAHPKRPHPMYASYLKVANGGKIVS